MEPTQPEFAADDEVEIDADGGGIRTGKVLKATADSYLVDTEHGAIWCGRHQVFAPGWHASPPASPSEPPPADETAETGEETADKPKRRAKKTR